MMRIDCSAEECGFPFFKVYYLSNNHYKVMDVKGFYLSSDNKWKVVFNVAFSSLNRLHRRTNENYFCIYAATREMVEEIIKELSENGVVYLNRYKQVFLK